MELTEIVDPHRAREKSTGLRHSRRLDAEAQKANKVIEQILERPLPNNLDAERSILGAVLLDNAALAPAAAIVGPGDFFLSQHRKTFGAMLAMRNAGEPIDITILVEHLFRRGELESAGGTGYLSELSSGMPRVTNVEHYARIVKQKAMLRSLAFAGEAMCQQALAAEDAPGAILERARSAISDLTQKSVQSAIRPVRVLSDILPITDLPEDKNQYLCERFVPKGGTAMFSGRPGKYKSWLALLLGNAVRTGGKFLGRFNCQKTQVVYLDRENTPGRIRLRARTIGIDQNDPMFKIWTKIQDPPKLGDPRLLEIAEQFQPLFIFDSLIRFGTVRDENSSAEIAALLEEAEKLTRRGGSNLILHHPPKNGPSWFRGSGDLEAFIDVGFSVAEMSSGSGLFKLECEKTRDDEFFELVFQPRPWLDDTGDVAVTEDPIKSRDDRDADKLAEFILKNPGLAKEKITTAKVLAQKRARQILDRFLDRRWRVENGLYGAERYHVIA